MSANHIIEAKRSASQVSGESAVSYLQVDAESQGQRLDNFLLRHLKGVPKTHVYRIIRSGEVRVNKGRAQASSRLSSGDQIRLPPIRVSARAHQAPAAPAREFETLFEDEHLLAIAKPAGVAVHGGSGVSFGVIEQLRQARPQQPFLELVHRLDRQTSGVLLLAKKRSALRKVQAEFRTRDVKKSYLALVRGAWPHNLKVIDVALHKYVDATGERRVRTLDANDARGRRSISLVQVQRGFADCSLLNVTIKTGRTHQIRVHLATSGHPIAGDDKYGDFEWNRVLSKRGLNRMFLHAWQLAFRHPLDGRLVRLEALLPTDLSDFVSMLESKAQP